MLGRSMLMFNAVRTTGIYCRPGCSARPRPENVSSFATRAEAEAAGFRPCKRCRPELEEALAFAIAATPLGRLLVARGERGIRSVMLGGSAATLERELRTDFPNAHLVRDRSGELERLARQIATQGTVAGMELDLRGTAFQLDVWRKLLEIPPGTTWTYTQLAQELGHPRAVRAVGRACGSNPLALLVPCHRVVRSDGELAGYRWGIERKRALLEAEGASLGSII